MVRDEIKELLLSEGTILEDRYEIREQIACGGFGTTYLVWDSMEQVMRAMKEFFPQDISTRMPDGTIVPTMEKFREAFEHGLLRFTEEAEMLYRLGGLPQGGVNRIVRLTDYFQAYGTRYYVMEYIDGLSLHAAIKKNKSGLPWSKVLKYAGEVCDGLEELHTKYQIFHRDISPENIMLTKEGHAVLIDFGNARNLSARKGYTVVLKIAYAPPEQYTSKTEQGAFTDVYSLAATIYYLLSGTLVPSADERLCEPGHGFTSLYELKPGIPKQISDALDHALAYSVTERTPSMRQFKQELGVDALLQGRQIKPPAPVRPKGKPFIKTISGESQIQKKPLLPDKTFLLGRSEQSDIQVGMNPYIGRTHCSVRYAAGEDAWYVRDYSRNGTYVDGACLPEDTEQKLAVGTHIVLANRICELELGVDYE